MHRHWQAYGYPPHIQLGHFFGTSKPAAKPEENEERDFAADMAAMFPGGWG